MKELFAENKPRCGVRKYKWKPISYREGYSEQLSINEAILINDINDKCPKAIDKINKYALKHNLNSESLIARIKQGDKVVISIFVKDPNRQTYHENVAASYISDIPLVQSFKTLPAGGPNALYIHQGRIINTKQPKMKSIDFAWTYTFKGKTLKIYAAHKFTNENGGAQDNQLYDVSKSNDYAMELLRFKDVYFFSITDGDYYAKKHTKDKINDVNKLEFLKMYEGPRNMATTSNRLTHDLASVLVDWLESTFEDPQVYKQEVAYIKAIAKKANYAYNKTSDTYI